MRAKARTPANNRRTMPHARPAFVVIAYSLSSSLSLPPGITYEPDSQRFKSTSRQRSEQNGFDASVAGLPQIGHFLADRLGAALPGRAFFDGLAGIQPAEADGKTFAAEQRDRLV
jgi:hypothetical protein